MSQRAEAQEVYKMDIGLDIKVLESSKGRLRIFEDFPLALAVMGCINNDSSDIVVRSIKDHQSPHQAELIALLNDRLLAKVLSIHVYMIEYKEQAKSGVVFKKVGLSKGTYPGQTIKEMSSYQGRGFLQVQWILIETTGKELHQPYRTDFTIYRLPRKDLNFFDDLSGQLLD